MRQGAAGLLIFAVAPGVGESRWSVTFVKGALFGFFAYGKPAGLPLGVLVGVHDEAGDARGGPVALAIDKEGALLAADDVGNAIWRMSARP